MKSKFFKTMIVVMSLALMVACGKKKDDGAQVNGGRDARVSTGSPNLPTGQGTAAGQMAAPVTQPNQASLEAAAKTLASATLDPATVGTINSVQLQGRVRVNPQTGAVMNDAGNPSGVRLTIIDSNAASGQAPNITIDVGGSTGSATGSAVNYNANLTFTDAYGTITIAGTYNMTSFTGTVTFTNTQGNGFNGQKSGTLGTFTIGTCSFFVCQ